MRGVAALTVIAFHAPAAFLPIDFPSGYLAVDFFFMLSGFVLTFAYQAKLDKGWSTFQFFKTRVVRLYPLYIVGLLLGLAVTVLLDVIHHKSAMATLPALGLGLLILPSMSGLSPVTAFPLNYPSWSIFFELIMNVVHAAFLRRRSTMTLVVLACLSFAGMATYAFRIGTINVGVDSPANILCLLRVAFSYLVGMLLYRRWQGGARVFRMPPALVALVLLGILAMPYTPRSRVVQELLVILLVFPLLILVASSAKTGPRWTRAFTRLGQASYAIYILHAPLFTLLNQTWARATHHPVNRAAPWFGIAFLVLLMVIALLIDRFYDVPARVYLRRKLLPHA